MNQGNRREFLANVGRGMLVASVGATLAYDMGLSPVWGNDSANDLKFGSLEPLVALMQETPPDQLLPILVGKLNSGTDLKTLVAAGALANARSFGGEDYVGFHTFMALTPAYQMSKELPAAQQALPVLKVLHRNSSRIQAVGGIGHQALHAVEASDLPAGRNGGELLQELVRRGDAQGAESAFAALAKSPAGEAYQHLQYEVQDETDVHRVVLSWRAWLMLDLAGQEHAHTMLRQSLRYCLMQEQYVIDKKRGPSSIRALLPKLFDQYKLLSGPLGTRDPGTAWVDDFSKTVYSAAREKVADAVAAALADGILPEVIGEAISLAANRLVLHDPGRRQAYQDKPVGSVHGDSVGVHASDAANAWRNIARVSNQRNTAASLIVGAFHTAGQSGVLNKEPYPQAEQVSQIDSSDPVKLLAELEAAIRAQNQSLACAVATRYADSGADSRPIFDLLLGFATSEDGALHAEKYYRTVVEEFATTRTDFRWRQVAALARVTASEFGKPAPGVAQARELLKLT